MAEPVRVEVRDIGATTQNSQQVRTPRSVYGPRLPRKIAPSATAGRIPLKA